MRFFILNWFGQMNPSELLNNHLKYSDFGFEFAERFEFSCIPCIIRIRKFSFHLLSEYGNFQNTEIFILRIISIRTISFHVLSANAKFFLKWKIHSAYCQYKLNFVPRILTIR
jgi:tRNA splicing ligase